MAGTPGDTPKRALYRAAEVCELAQLQPYVLRSWEAEFPNLGVTRPGGGRVYRQEDLDRVLEIKQLLFVEGLTIAGARRRLEQTRIEPRIEELPVEDVLADDVRTRLLEVKRGLSALLELLSRAPSSGAFELRAPSSGNGRAEVAGAPRSRTDKRKR